MTSAALPVLTYDTQDDEELNMREIGEVLGITESRVSSFGPKPWFTGARGSAIG
ncbi:MAG: sigma factor-like helix-turn-helix DNA-binding protein [Gammaproteobacteria bacterium]